MRSLLIVLLVACGSGSSSPPDAAVISADAAIGAGCGDTVCGLMENCVNCPTDCGVCPAGCGDSTCSAAETCQTCPADCGTCAIGCGDGTCSTDESCSSCPIDCSCPTAGTRLAAGGSLKFQDVSADGAYIAYTDASGTLFRVATDGASAPVQVSTGVTKARFKGNFLVTFSGIDATGKYATSMAVFAKTGTSPIRSDGPNVRVQSVIATADGAHYAYLRGGSGQPRDVLLDGQVMFSAATSAKIQFTPNSTFLVAGLWYLDGSAVQVQPVLAYPVAGGTPVTLVADGAGTSFAIIPSGAAVVVAENDNGGTADLTLVPISGSAGSLVATGDDTGFSVLPDGTTLVYVDAGALRKVQLSGAGGMTLVGSGVVTVEDVSQQSIAYATFQDATTGLETLRIVRTSGTADSAIGTGAASEHFTPGATFFAARTDVVATAGNLVVMSVASLTGASLASNVTKSSFPDETRVVYVDSIGRLAVVANSGGSPIQIQTRVNTFELVPDALGSATRGRAAYVISTGVDAGLYVTPF